MTGTAVARRLAEPDVARDHGVEDERREVRADLALDVLGELRARVVHRQQHPRDRQPRVELALDQVERVEQAGQALEREVLGLHRDDHAVGGDERVDRQRAERRRAVEQDERVARRARGASASRRRFSEPGSRGSSIVAPARSGVDASSDRPLDVGRPDGLARGDVAAEDVVDARRRRRATRRGRSWRCPADRRRRAASRSRPRRCRRRR